MAKPYRIEVKGRSLSEWKYLLDTAIADQTFGRTRYCASGLEYLDVLLGRDELFEAFRSAIEKLQVVQERFWSSKS